MAGKHLLEAAQVEMMENFKALNSPFVEELEEEPSPLEFMRFVARNLPFVVRGAASSWKATQKWDASYLKLALEGQTVNVAVTPMGNADAPLYSEEHNRMVISKPHEEAQPFDEFLTHVIQQETDLDPSPSSEIRYAQTQNDNLRDEYLPLFPDVPKDIPFARIALEKQPEAINLWIGNSKSVTAMHKDNYENIFVQIIGRKHFVLLPPLFQACMNEQLLAPATYVRREETLALRLDPGAELVPMATWEPDNPLVNQSSLSHIANPLRVTLNPGDMLYLPAMWYRKVKQSCLDDREGFVLAINYWYILRCHDLTTLSSEPGARYACFEADFPHQVADLNRYDMDFSGPLYSTAMFLRSIGLLECPPPASTPSFRSGLKTTPPT